MTLKKPSKQIADSQEGWLNRPSRKDKKLLLGHITDGVTTYHFTDMMDGVEYNNQFYYPYITASGDISFGGEPHVKLEIGSLTFNLQDTPALQTKREWDIELVFTTDVDFTLVIDPIFTGKAIVRDKTKDEITLKLKDDELLYDLLTPAPNTNIGEGKYAGTWTSLWKKAHSENVYVFYGTEAPLVDYNRILFYRPIVNDGLLVVQDHTGTITYTEGTDYEIDYTGGAITVKPTGTISNLAQIVVSYNYSIYRDKDVVFHNGLYYRNHVAGGATVTSPPDPPWEVVPDEDAFSEGRAYPIMIGLAGNANGNPATIGGDGLYIQPLQLNDYQLVYFNSHGTILGVFDKGIPVEYETFSDGRFQLKRNPVDQITLMVDGNTYNFNDAYAVTTVTSDFKVPYPNTTYTQATAPNPDDVFLKENDTWINTSAGNAMFNWDGGSWESVSNTVFSIETTDINKGYVQFPTNDAEPAGAKDGAVYYDTSTDKLRLKAAGVWVNLN